MEMRDNFARICDDLCEEILKYLPFNRKLTLECVSRQFTRCVFAKSNRTLHVNKSRNANNTDQCITLNQLSQHYNRNKLNSNALSKFRCVTRVEIDRNNSFYLIPTKFLRLIADICDKLSSRGHIWPFSRAREKGQICPKQEVAILNFEKVSHEIFEKVSHEIFSKIFCNFYEIFIIFLKFL